MRMQAKSSQTEISTGEDAVTLTISPEKVCFIIIKAKEFDAKDEVTEPDSGSNPSDDKDVAVLEDHADDPVVEELTSLINSLSEDEQIDLVALTWLGRDDYTASDWAAVREEAARAHNERTAEYLLGTPLVGDFLQEGLSMLGNKIRWQAVHRRLTITASNFSSAYRRSQRLPKCLPFVHAGSRPLIGRRLDTDPASATL
jgi:hypothetical protein